MTDKETPIAEGMCDFADMRRDGCVYVDKTACFHQLLTWAGKRFFFLLRPRRFGKSLMLSTLKYILQGRRELFQGLAIADTDYDWPEVKVLHFDMSDVETATGEAFENDFARHVSGVLTRAGAAYDSQFSAAGNFANALVSLSDGGTHPVAVLIDEYDAPIGHALDDKPLARRMQKTLADFYIKLKAHSSCITFLMITGVSKFVKTSVFSALNNIKDLSFNPVAAAMLGYTEEELMVNFDVHMRAHAKVMGLSYGDYRKALKHWFNGYRFALGAPTVYNPASIAAILSDKAPDFDTYWTDMVPPSVLAKFLPDNPISGEAIFSHPEASMSDISSTCDLDNLETVPMLYQAGYLTIEGPGTLAGDMRLCIPDEEIRRNLYALYINMLTGKSGSGWRKETFRALKRGDTETFFEKIPLLFSRLNYGATESGSRQVQEFNYQRILQTLFLVFGIPCETEKKNADGRRIDLAVELDDLVYIFELKRRNPTGDSVSRTVTAQDALQQIRGGHYADAYLGLGKRIILIGMVFDAVTHKLIETAAEDGADGALRANE